ncbi:MAG: recombination mediator RecR [Candidatus Omnitrophota bacterium]
MAYTKAIEKLIEEFKKLPGVGPRTAERLAFFILNSPNSQAKALAEAIVKVKESIISCKTCGNLSEKETCDICSDAKRDKSIICVVEHPKDVVLIEKSGTYNGAYHVLWGALSPLDGIGPDDIKIKALLERARNNRITELIIATNSDTEGEATALYLSETLKPLGIKLSRIAYGLPMGGRLEYQDYVTLGKALEGRRPLT